MTNSVDDPRLRFYLERRDAIDEWARLRELEAPEVSRFLRSLDSDLQATAEEAGADVDSGIFAIAGEEVIGLYRRAWLPLGAEWPTAIVGVGWWPKSARFISDDKAPWVGLRVRRSESFVHTRELVGQLVDQRSTGKVEFPLGNPTRNSPWVRYRWAPCHHPGFWLDLSPYRAELVDQVTSAFAIFAPVVDEALSMTERPAS